MKRRHERPALPRCVLDSGGLTALGGGSQRARAWLRWVVENAGSIQVPTPVLVESTTGDAERGAEVNGILGVLPPRYASAEPVPLDMARQVWE